MKISKIEFILLLSVLIFTFILVYSIYNFSYRKSECLEYETKLMITPMIINKIVINQIVTRKVCTKYAD